MEEAHHARIGVYPDPGIRESGYPWLGSVGPTSLIALSLAALYWPILRDLAIQWWEDDQYTHGFLVPLFSAALVWRRWPRLRLLVPRGTWLGLPVLLGGIGALLAGEIAVESFMMRSSLILILAGLVLLHLGTQVFRGVLFPLAFLFFMVPLPAIAFYAMTFPLQRLAAEQAAWALDLLGVPVLLDGNIIQLSQITLGVTEACSGIRSLFALLAGAVALAHLTLPVSWGMGVLVASVLPITIVANVVRVVSTGLIGQWLGVEYASGFFHTFSGWAIYVFGLVALLATYALIRAVGRRGRGRGA